MKYVVMCSINLVSLIVFIDLFFPRFEENSKDKFTDWYLRFSDLDYRSIGPYMANMATNRLDQLLGTNKLGWRFFITTTLLSQVIFVALVAYIAISWEIVAANDTRSLANFFNQSLDRLGHSLVPLLCINTIGDLISIYITRDLLRRASKSISLWVFGILLLIDISCAAALGAITFLVFSQFIFAHNFADSLAAFALNGSLVYVFLFVAAIGAFFVLTSIQEKGSLRGFFLGFGAYALWIAGVMAVKFIEAETYSKFLSFGIDDLTAVLILAVSATAGIPTLLGLFILLLMFFINIFIGKLHGAGSAFLLRMAETKKGFITFISVILTALADTLLFIYFDTK